jgi:hypothetical protein
MSWIEGERPGLLVSLWVHLQEVALLLILFLLQVIPEKMMKAIIFVGIIIVFLFRRT